MSRKYYREHKFLIGTSKDPSHEGRRRPIVEISLTADSPVKLHNKSFALRSGLYLKYTEGGGSYSWSYRSTKEHHVNLYIELFNLSVMARYNWLTHRESHEDVAARVAWGEEARRRVLADANTQLCFHDPGSNWQPTERSRATVEPVDGSIAVVEEVIGERFCAPCQRTLTFSTETMRFMATRPDRRN